MSDAKVIPAPVAIPQIQVYVPSDGLVCVDVVKGLP